MSRTAFRFIRLLGPLSLAAALGASTLPAFAQSSSPSGSGSCSSIDFQLANPSPGTRVEAGNNIVEGIALDTSAPSNSNSIDRVDFFLGNRDEGGLSLGTAVPNMAPGPFGAGSFQTTLDFPNTQMGGHDLWAYAHDSVTGQESVISEPISIGEDASKAFVTPPPDSANQMCLGTSGAASTSVSMPSPSTSTTTSTMPSTSTSTSMPSTTTTTTSASPSAQSIVLNVGNPSPGDTVHVGAYIIMGQAFDKSAQSGSGIDRVSIFLDNRDQGGMSLGQAVLGNNNMWAAQIAIPSNQTGLHTMWFYAHSSVTDQEMAVSVPITVAP